MKVILLNRYSRMGPSSRLRTLQYIPYLEERGIQVKPSPLFEDSYVRDLQLGKRKNPRCIFNAFLRRAETVCCLEQFDIVWIEKEMLPWLPFFVERAMLTKSPPIVLDIDDADFHHYDQNRSGFIRSLLGSKIGRLMRMSALVIAGNDYLAGYARRWGARSVEQLPTAVDLARYPLKECPTGEKGPVTIGWIGSPTTAPYLKIIEPVLRDLSRNFPIKLVLVGSGAVTLEGLKPDIQPWTEEKEAELVSGFDIGIMPLADTPWERGKCGYKLIQYMACARPVVASAIGANLSIVTQGKEGFLVKALNEWKEALEALIKDADLRRQMGMAGRQLVEKKYCTSITAPRLLNLLRTVSCREKK